MSEFDKWFYTADKCDNIFDTIDLPNHIYYKAKYVWDYKEQQLKEKLKIAVDALEFLHTKSSDFAFHKKDGVKAIRLQVNKLTL